MLIHNFVKAHQQLQQQQQVSKDIKLQSIYFWKMRSNVMYQRYIVAFMSHLHGMQYEKDMVFSDVELSNVTATDVEHYLCLKAYGVMEIVSNLERPTLCRSNTLEVYKKAISFCIPNRIPTWDPVSKIGNPTKSVDVNQLIKAVRKHEVRTEGAKSQVKRD